MGLKESRVAEINEKMWITMQDLCLGFILDGGQTCTDYVLQERLSVCNEKLRSLFMF